MCLSGWLKPPVVPSNLVRVLLDADLWHFGVLTSSMHMAWLRQIGGTPQERLPVFHRDRLQYIPLAEATDPQRARIRLLAPGSPRRARAVFDLDAGRPLRYRCHASAIAETTARSTGRWTSYTAPPVHWRSRPGGASLRTLRKTRGASGCRDPTTGFRANRIAKTSPQECRDGRPGICATEAEATASPGGHRDGAPGKPG